MATSTGQGPPNHATTLKLFADLRQRNERAARVAQMLEARRKRQIEQAIRTERQRRIHQAR